MVWAGKNRTLSPNNNIGDFARFLRSSPVNISFSPFTSVGANSYLMLIDAFL